MNKIFEEISKLSTEQINQNTTEIDVLPVEDCLKLINEEDKVVAFKVETFIPKIKIATNFVINAFKNGGRLIYIGAGTSGRLGVLDAVECPPTFGANPEMVKGIMAGGNQAMFLAQEGAEDSKQLAREDLINEKINKNDVVCGLAASGRTPYVIGGLDYAKSTGCKTILISTSEIFDKNIQADVLINPILGPEAIMGSTRMKSGTAQKMILNMITTVAFVKLGKTYNNIMVDLQMTNQKLKERAKKTIITVCEVDYHTAEQFLKKADNHVKTAIMMLLANVSKEKAKSMLELSDNKIKTALRSN
ncbi:N-acetylmuramic acid 6-phosphate etherase [Candidatus Kapabacteria bacterium]|nr:N-acetylmuramic acid 6-phosphate etherase [Candidatus Kapabacteria bacterium]